MSIIAVPLGYVMELIYSMVENYGWTLIWFTLITKVLLFPLSVKQQKSMARNAAFQPMMQEIQKKWENDKKRQQEEMMKFQQESGFSMTAGCLPMIINMVVILGLIQVIYRPMQYILKVSEEVIESATAMADLSASVSVQNNLINAVKANPDLFGDMFGDKLDAIVNFNFEFMGMDLSVVPDIGFNLPILLPILAVATMLLAQTITTKMSGQEIQGSMKYLPWIMSITFGYFCFTVPAGFSLYYTVSNVLMLGQSMLLKIKYDPKKMKEQVLLEIEEKRALAKKKKDVVLVQEDGTTVSKKVTDAELARIRLAKARELDAKRYEEE